MQTADDFLAACAQEFNSWTAADEQAWKTVILSSVGKKVLGRLQLELMRLGAEALAIKTLDPNTNTLVALSMVQGKAQGFSHFLQLLLTIMEPDDAARPTDDN